MLISLNSTREVAQASIVYDYILAKIDGENLLTIDLIDSAKDEKNLKVLFGRFRDQVLF